MAAKKSPIQNWLDSKERNYQEGVNLYAQHPTAMRGLVNTLQRKENDYTREKLVYVMEKAAQADTDGATKKLKKKGKKPAGKKSTGGSQQSVVKTKGKQEIPKKPTPEKKMPEIPAKKEGPAPAPKPHEEEE